MANWWANYIAQGARRRGLDPKAVLAIARVEGLSGAVGDRGTSFGPFQLHVGGALPRGKDRAWAESPAGIDYALNRIAQVAGGLRGRSAISAISSRFERPADVAGEVSKASALYGLSSGGGSVGGPSVGSGLGAGPSAQGSAPDIRPSIIQGLIAASQAQSRGQPADYSSVFAGLSQLGSRGAGGYAPPERSGAQGPSTGAAPGGGSSLSYLTPLAGRFGLTISSTTGGHHVPGSYHYQGRAEDYSGNTSKEAALQRYAIAHAGQFREVFYTGPGAAPYYVKNGRVYPVSSLDPSVARGHTDHVHIAR